MTAQYITLSWSWLKMYYRIPDVIFMVWTILWNILVLYCMMWSKNTSLTGLSFPQVYFIRMDFMNLNWIIFMKEICKKLGCKSENALNYFKKRFDHHKLWHVVQIWCIVLSGKLLMPHIHHRLLENIECFAENYWESADDVINNTYTWSTNVFHIFIFK